MATEGRTVTEPPRLELYLRSLAPATGRDQQDRVVRRLHDLDGDGRIKGFDVLRRYERFAEWAEEAGYDLTGFERREVDSVLTGTTVTGIAFPRIVLAEYRGGSLTFVAPAADGSETVTVQDRLDSL